MHPTSAKGLMPTSECPKAGTVSATFALRGKSYGNNVLDWACTVALSATAMSLLDGPSIGSPADYTTLFRSLRKSLGVSRLFLRDRKSVV